MPGPIQMLDFIVDPSSPALLTDDGLHGQTPPGTTIDGVDVSTGGGEGAGSPEIDPRSGVHIRVGGSGSRRPATGSGTKTIAIARDDSLSTEVGAVASDIDVLANDTYIGTPRIIILDRPVYGTAVVVNSGSGSRIRYTPPSTGTPESDSFTYWLRSTGNARSSGNTRSQDVATVNVDFTSDWTFIQASTTPRAALNPSNTASFSAPVTSGNLLVACIGVFSAAGDDITLTVEDSVGNLYTQAGTYATYVPQFSSSIVKLSMWYRNSAVAGPDSVLVTTAGGVCSGVIGLMEHHKGAPGVLNGANTSAEGILFPPNWTTNTIPNAGGKELVIVSFMTTNSDETGNFTFDFATLRCDHPRGDLDLTDIAFWAGDILDEQLAIPQTATDLGGNHYAGIGASFHT